MRYFMSELRWLLIDLAYSARDYMAKRARR